METITLKFKASGQKLTADSCPQNYASNTVNYIQAEFELGHNWDGFDSVRAVWHNDFACISTVLDGNGACTVPHEVLENLDETQVNLVGSIVDGTELTDRLTTYPIRAAIIDAEALICGTETAEVTPSQFEQYIAIVEQIVGTVKDIDHTELTDDYCLIIYYSDGTNSGKLGPIRGATGATGNGIVSAELNADYTLTLTYDNGDSDTVGPIRGAQGETGNGIQSVYLTETHGAVKTYTILFTDGTTTTFDVTDGEVTLAQLSAVLPTDTASGAIASFEDGSDLFDYLSCVVNINPVQDLHGYDKPWVGGAGVNILEPKSGVSNGITFTPNTDGTINLNGTFTNNAWTQIIGTFTLTELGLSVGDVITVYSDLHIGLESYNSSDARINFTTSVNTFKQYTIPNDTVYINVVYYAVTSTSEIAGTSINRNVKYLVAKGTVNTWTPFANICHITGWTGCNLVVSPTEDAQDGTTYPISWQTEAGTVYGGTVDVVSGVLTVKYGVFDLGTGTYTTTSNRATIMGFATDHNAKLPASDAVTGGYLAEKYKELKASGTLTSGTFAMLQSGQLIFFYDGVNTPTGQLVYPLATPTTYQLTPQQVATLLGQNNVWADCGDTSVTYKADVQRWVEKKLGA